MIARHPLWSTRPLVRLRAGPEYRTPRSPCPYGSWRRMKLIDLRELYQDPSLPVTVKPFVHRELLSGAANPRPSVQERCSRSGRRSSREFEAARPELQEEPASKRNEGSPEDRTRKMREKTAEF